eukprot:7277375-Pyramimonas_sp.AAC.1
MKPCQPCGTAICDMLETFEGCWGVQRSTVLRRSKLGLAILGVLRTAKLSTLARMRELLGGTED